MEIIVEVVLALLVDFVGELLIDLGWRGTRELVDDVRTSRTGRRVDVLGVIAVVVAGVGFWRGDVVGGFGWGFWVSIVVLAVTACAALVRLRVPAGPRPERHAALTWWPASRLAWLAVANSIYVCAYAIGQLEPAASALA